MNTIFPKNFLMSDAERDREMQNHFREQAEKEAAERAARQSEYVDPPLGDDAAEANPPSGEADEAIDQEIKAMLEAMSKGESLPVRGAATHPVPAESDSAASVAASPMVASSAADTSGSAPRGVADLSVFPVPSAAELAPSVDPQRDLANLCREIHVHKDYPRVRENYCSLSIQLNERGRLAPAYRPLIKTGAEWGNAMNMVLHRDRLVIDLHWIYVKKMSISAGDGIYQALFDLGGAFPFDLAWAISGEKWRSQYRAAEALCLTTLQQCQLLKLRGPEVADRAKALEKGWKESGGKRASRMAVAKRLIGQWAEREKRMHTPRDHYEKLWLARELLGPGSSIAQVAELHALMVGGDVQDRATIRDKLKSLDKQLKGL